MMRYVVKQSYHDDHHTSIFYLRVLISKLINKLNKLLLLKYPKWHITLMNRDD